MNELYRYTVLRLGTATGSSGVTLPESSQSLPDLSKEPYKRPALAVALYGFPDAPPATAAELASILEAIGIKASGRETEQRLRLADALGQGAAREQFAAAASAVRAALADRRSQERTLVIACADVVSIATFMEWASGKRSDDAWAAGRARLVVRPAPSSPERAAPSVPSKKAAAVQRLADLVSMASAIEKAPKKDRDSVLMSASTSAKAALEKTIAPGEDVARASAKLASEGNQLITFLRAGDSPISWGGINANAGFAYRAPHLISGTRSMDFETLSQLLSIEGLDYFSLFFGNENVRPGPSGLMPIGRQDLIVVRSRHLGYRLAELSHIENVAAGETRERTHRIETQVEMISVEETVHEKETEEDLKTTSKDELRDEVQTQTNEKLQLSGKVRLTYRGPVEVEVEASADYGRENERRINTTRSHAIEVTQEAANRVRDRVTRRNERRFRRIVSETNRHAFVNGDPQGRTVPYVWLQKVDRLALYNYGTRQMYEIVVPEPAAHLRALSTSAPGPEVPLRPPPTAYFNKLMSGSPNVLDEWDSGALLYHFSLGEVQPPAKEQWIEQTASATDASPETAPETRLSVPVGRVGTKMRVSVQTFATTGVPLLSLVVGPFHLWLNEDTLSRVSSSENTSDVLRPYRWQMLVGAGSRETFGNFTGGVSDEHGVDLGEVALGFLTGAWWLAAVPGGGTTPASSGRPYEAFEADLSGLNVPLVAGDYQVKVIASGGTSYAITVSVLTVPTDDGKEQFRRALTVAVVQDYWKQYEQYASLALADNPAQGKGLLENLSDAQSAELREIERDEVKRSALAIIRNTDSSGPSSMNGTKPAVSRWYRENREYADELMFLEMAFEWQHMSFVLYGYEWSDPAQWDLQIFGQRGGDRGFREFLKAGAARVQIPVRPGFEGFVDDYMSDGVVWSGKARPSIGSPGFLDIIEERLERLGVPEDEVPVTERIGDDGSRRPVYWDVTTPTDLVMIRVWDDPANAPLDRMIPTAPDTLVTAAREAPADPLVGWSYGTGPVPDDPHN